MGNVGKAVNPMLYFIPGERGLGADRGVLRRVGLWPVMNDTSVAYREVTRGPGGQQGIVVAANYDGAVVIDESAQTWVECAGGAYWVGYWTDRKPGPADLIRGEYIDGHAVELNDGNQWIIPVARLVDGDTNLPQVIGWDKDGNVRVSVSAKFADFHARGLQMFDRIVETGQFAESSDALLEMVVDALTVNYRVGKWEAGALQLITTNSMRKVAWAIVDGPAIDAQQTIQKKTVSDTTDTECGDAA